MQISTVTVYPLMILLSVIFRINQFIQLGVYINKLNMTYLLKSNYIMMARKEVTVKHRLQDHLCDWAKVVSIVGWSLFCGRIKCKTENGGRNCGVFLIRGFTVIDEMGRVRVVIFLFYFLISKISNAYLHASLINKRTTKAY